MIRIEDVFETPEVLYIILELYHSMKHSTSNMSFISLFLVSCIDREYKKSKVYMNGGIGCQHVGLGSGCRPEFKPFPHSFSLNKKLHSTLSRLLTHQ